MKATQQTIQQIQRAIHKVASKFPKDAEPVLTDIHMQVKPESAELLTYNDDMEELDRAVIGQWLEPTEEDLYEVAAPVIKQCLGQLRKEIDAMSILHPFSFVLMGEDGETICELYLVDEDAMKLEPPLLRGLDRELDAVLEDLIKD